MSRPYPLLLEPILLEKVWGGDRLSTLGKKCPPGMLIGESWELADLARTSLSGAGGDSICSRIINGPLAGKTLHEAILLWGSDLFSRVPSAPRGDFPLLVKYLDARESLSVQVHPSPAYAAAHLDCHLKTECWYVVQAQPGSVIYKGLRPGISRDRFASDLRAGCVLDNLQVYPAAVGDCHLLPSGTCHALGAGVLVAEVQTPSDTTFRLYDWGRQGRALHLEQALACLDDHPPPATTRRAAGERWATLAKTAYFTVSEGFISALPPPDGRCRVLMVLEGEARLGDFIAPAGQTVLLPAMWENQITGPGQARVLLAELQN